MTATLHIHASPARTMLQRGWAVPRGVAYSQHHLHNYAHAFHSQRRRARRLGLRRGRAAAPAGPPSRPGGGLGGRGLLGRPAPRRPLPRPAGRLRRPRLLLGRRGAGEGGRPALLRPAARAGGRDRPPGAGRRRGGGRPLGRLPAPRPGCLPRLVRGRAPVSGPARGLALRPARAAPRPAAGRRQGGRARLLPNRRPARPGPAGRGRAGGHRRDRGRRQVGAVGGRRSLTDANLFVQANENVAPYKVGSHRHTPEIEQELALAAGAPVTVTFTPHLVPASRGILATCYATLAPSAGDEELAACYAAAYGGEPFVDLLQPGGGWPATRAVATTNRAQVAAAADRRTGRVVAAAAIDNLVKGAAGQALQCANLALGLPETAGLDLVPPGP